VSATLNAVPDALVSKAHYPIVQSAQGFELPLNNGISLRVAPAEPNLPANDNAWQLACVNAAEPWITAPTVDQFVPQMVNFDVLNGVHFQKGCYPGQEIVHRTKMLGRVRRRAVIATAAVQASEAKAGDSVYSKQLGGEQAAGMVIAAAIDGTQSKLLISSMLEGVAANDLSLSSQFETMLTCVNPPYRVAELS
jgi:tRNA-modifying protein YgfZ